MKSKVQLRASARGSVLGLTCVVGCAGGVRSSGCKPKGFRSIRELQVKRKAGRVNASKPLLMPRHRKPRRWVVGAGSRTGRWEAAATTGRPHAGRESTAVPGYRGHPPRSYLARVQRDDPVGVRAQSPGKPTAREAQPPSGRTMAKKRMPVVERQQETGTRWLAPPPVVLDNWPDTGPCGPARKGAQVAR